MTDARRAELAMLMIFHDLDGRPREEVSELLGIPAGTVASRLQLARKIIEDDLG